MVHAYHAIFAAHGFWLPNDPRGSWSKWVARWELVLAGGRATKTNETRSLAHDEHDWRARIEAKKALKYPAVEFTGHQALAISQGFARAAIEGGYAIHACAILPDHAHHVIGRTSRNIRQVVDHLKSKATMRLMELGLHPLGAYTKPDGNTPSPWVERCWVVYLDSLDDVARAIKYVEGNPIKEGKREQRWPFVRPFRT